MKYLLLALATGCVINPDATDEAVSTAASAVIAACKAGTWCTEMDPVSTAPRLHGVWAVDANEVFAVGGGGAIWHRSSTAWNLMSSGTTNDLSGVWAASSSDAWAVGANGTILRFNGTAWSSVDAGIATTALDAVWGSSASDVWITASTGILHWNGTVFSLQNFGTGHLLSVSGTGPHDVWTTGEDSRLRHFTGSWSPMINPGVAGTNTYFAVLAVGSDVWATDFTPGKETVRLSAGRWSAQKTGSVFNGLAGFTPTDIWGAGNNTRIGHWDGSAWSVTQPVAPAGGITLWAVATTPGHVWVVGGSSLIAHLPL